MRSDEVCSRPVTGDAVRIATRVCGLVLALASAGALASCASDSALPESGAVLLDVRLPANARAFDEIRAWVYDRHGVVFKNARLPAAGPLPTPQGQKLGTILIQPGTTSGDLRIHLRGLAVQQRACDGIVVVTAAMRTRPSVEVDMQLPVPADVDLDDVPDVIDDCLPGFNPDQGGCVGGGHADASADAGAGPDGADTGGSIGGSPGAGGTTAGTGGATGAGGTTAGTGGATGAGGTTAGTGGATGAGGTTAGTGGATGTGGRGATGGSPGCQLAVSGSAEEALTLAEVEGGNSVTRQYWLSRPTTYDPQTLHKLMVVLGAPASSADSIRQQVGVQTGAAAAAGASDEIFVYPFARVRDFGSWGTLAAWQLGPGAAQTPAAGLDDLHFIDDVLNDVGARFCIDTQRVFVIGFGWGADFANALACERGTRLRAIASAANNGTVALTNPTVSCMGQAATWTMQGKGDPQLGLAKGRTTLDYWLNRHGCSNNTQALAVAGPSGNEDCVSYAGCGQATRWCAYDASFGGSAPSYLGREALGFFRGF